MFDLQFFWLGGAEGEELETNILRVLLRECAYSCEALRRRTVALLMQRRHRSLSHLVKRAGMTPARAMQAATIVNAAVMGWQDRIGSIDKGKYADLIAVRPRCGWQGRAP
jgi:cytosine/adenosine deaminase-related metal-dependent hydrolase